MSPHLGLSIMAGAALAGVSEIAFYHDPKLYDPLEYFLPTPAQEQAAARRRDVQRMSAALLLGNLNEDASYQPVPVKKRERRKRPQKPNRAQRRATPELPDER